MNDWNRCKDTAAESWTPEACLWESRWNVGHEGRMAPRRGHCSGLVRIVPLSLPFWVTKQGCFDPSVTKEGCFGFSQVYVSFGSSARRSQRTDASDWLFRVHELRCDRFDFRTVRYFGFDIASTLPQSATSVFFRKGGWCGWKPSSRSNFSIRVVRAQSSHFEFSRAYRQLSF